MGMRAFSVGVAVAVVGVCASPAWGAFRGRDGDLVVASGAGLELVSPATGTARSICSGVLVCGHPARPAFSPNGRAIAFLDTTSRRAVVVAANGSCLWCLLGRPLTARTGSVPAFMPGGRAITVAGNGLWSVSLTGAAARSILRGRVGGAVWSSRGLVALVRGGWIWVGRPGHGKLRRLARGRSPSFSPDGTRLALARAGYVWIARVAGGGERRLVRGVAPGWSPSGRLIAYIATGGAVEIVGANGGPVRRVGSVRGTSLDWQPLPPSAGHACNPPAGSTVLESTRDAVVYSKGGALYGCLEALGRRRLLLDTSGCYCGPVMAVRLAGRFAALQAGFGKPPTVSERDTLYDLSSGRSTRLASVPLQTPEGSLGYGLDSLALDSSGFSAWRETVRAPLGIAAVSCPSESLCVAGDQAGNILSSSNPTGGPAAWTSASASPNQSIHGVSCPTTSLCVAGDSAGDILTSTDPTSGANAWTKTTVDPEAFINAVACPSTSLCVAAGGTTASGGGATILTSTDPTAGAGSWSVASIASGGVVTAVSCPSVSLCVATTNMGEAFTSGNPAGGANAWTKATVDPGGFLIGVSCPSVSLCVAGGTGPAGFSNGEILTTTRPGGGVGAWTKITIDPGMSDRPVTLAALSCASVSLCVTGDNFGNILTSIDPTGGASAWMKASFEPGGTSLSTISCPSVSLCVAANGQGNLVTSTHPAAGASTWTHATLSERLYSHDDQRTRVVDTAPPGQGNSIGDVSLHGDSLILTWTHDATRRRLALH
jgi:WD40-like Beta Propeller Repeat